MKFYIGKAEAALTKHLTFKELSRALHVTQTAPNYADLLLFTYDDNDNLISAELIGDQKFLHTRVWFYKELHILQELYGLWDEQRSFPRLERELREKLWQKPDTST